MVPVSSKDLFEAIQKSVTYFFGRDFIFIIGGSVVILSFFYAFDKISFLNLHWFYLIIGAGISYVVGYAIQDFLSIFRIVSTVSPNNVGPITRFVFRLFTRAKWKPIPKKFNPMDKYFEFVDLAPPKLFVELQRIVTLKQIGTTVGPCLIISSILIAVKIFIFKDILQVFSSYDNIPLLYENEKTIMFEFSYMILAFFRFIRLMSSSACADGII